MLHIGICDDEKIETEYLQALVKNWAGDRKISVCCFFSAESFLFEYAENKDFNILLLDIQMNKMDGVALAKRIREENSAVQIVFITGFPDFMSEGFEVDALHYLLKPIDEKKLFDVLDKAVFRLVSVEKMLYITVEGEQLCVPQDDIEYIEVLDHYLEISTLSSTLGVKMPLYEIENKLTEDFIRCHRSYVVNMSHVKKITRTEILTDSGKRIPISRRLYGDVNRAMLKYIIK